MKQRRFVRVWKKYNSCKECRLCTRVVEFTLQMKCKLVCYKTADVLVITYVFRIKLSRERVGHCLSLALFLSGDCKTLLSFRGEINYIHAFRVQMHMSALDCRGATAYPNRTGPDGKLKRGQIDINSRVKSRHRNINYLKISWIWVTAGELCGLLVRV